MHKSKLIVISAPSGAGKTTLCDMLLKEFPNITRSISATTRPIRKGEVDGEDYFFLTEKDFKKRLKQNEFIEHAVVHEYYYGIPQDFIEKALKNKKHVLFNIDVQGAFTIQKKYPKDTLLIFITPPSIEELENRLKKREESQDTIEKRIQNAYNEIEWSKEFHYKILNDNLQEAFQKLKEIVQNECK
jgi:guanylate kinase